MAFDPPAHTLPHAPQLLGSLFSCVGSQEPPPEEPPLEELPLEEPPLEELLLDEPPPEDPPTTPLEDPPPLDELLLDDPVPLEEPLLEDPPLDEPLPDAPLLLEDEPPLDDELPRGDPPLLDDELLPGVGVPASAGVCGLPGPAEATGGVVPSLGDDATLPVQPETKNNSDPISNARFLCMTSSPLPEIRHSLTPG